MPKTKRLSTKRSAVLARERREREKEQQQYNSTLKEFMLVKYRHIIAEFDPFYEQLKANHPANLIYTNTNEFRLWRKQYMEKTFSEQQQQQCDDGTNDEQQAGQLPEQEEQHAEQLPEQEEQHAEQLPEQEEQHAKQLPEQEEQHAEQLPEQEEQHAEQLPEQEEQHAEQLPEQEEQLGELARLVNEIVGEAEIEMEHEDDEGIALDIYEELQADIESFDYQLEVELEQYL